MRYGEQTLKALVIVVAIVLATGIAAACSPLDEREIAEREYQRENYLLQFLDFKRACERAGGWVVIRAHQRIGPDGLPNPGDHYRCERD